MRTRVYGTLLKRRRSEGSVVNHYYLMRMIFRDRHCFEVRIRLIELKSVNAKKRRNKHNNNRLEKTIDFNRPLLARRKSERSSGDDLN
jgi:ribosomal protein S26